MVEKDAELIGGSVLRSSSGGKDKKKDPSEAKPSLIALPNVFALGDCASSSAGALPATAQVATQQGKYIASLFNSAYASEKKFKFDNKGSMASIGSNKALIDSPVKKESGALAWVLWRSAYTIMSMSWRNRFLVPANWASNLFFGRDVGRF